MKKALLMFSLLLYGSLGFTQPCPEPPCPPGGDGTPPVPIDGIGILLTVGAAYGAKKIIGLKRKR
jgi:hypothetical protein